MKLFQFQVGENTKFLYRNTPENHPVVEAAEAVNEASTKDLKTLKGEIDAMGEMGTGDWKLKKKKSGRKIWTNEVTGETIVFRKNGKFLRYENTKSEIKYKTNRLNKSDDIRKIVTKEGKVKIRRDGTIKKIVTNDGVRAKFQKDGSLKKGKNLGEDAISEVKKIATIVREKTPQDQKKSTKKLATKSNHSEQSETTTSGNQYVIQSGDTLSNIAALCKDKNGKILDWNVLYNLNKDALRGGRASLIFPGETITIPKGYTLNGKTLPAVRTKNKADWKEWRAKQASTNKKQTNIPETHTGGNNNSPTDTPTNGSDVVVIPSNNHQQGAEAIPYNSEKISAPVKTCYAFLTKKNGELKNPEDVTMGTNWLDIPSADIKNLTDEDFKYLKNVSELAIKTDATDISSLSSLENITDLNLENATDIPKTLKNIIELYAPKATFNLSDFPDLVSFTGINYSDQLPAVGQTDERNKIMIVNGEIMKNKERIKKFIKSNDLNDFIVESGEDTGITINFLGLEAFLSPIGLKFSEFIKKQTPNITNTYEVPLLKEDGSVSPVGVRIKNGNMVGFFDITTTNFAKKGSRTISKTVTFNDKEYEIQNKEAGGRIVEKTKQKDDLSAKKQTDNETDGSALETQPLTTEEQKKYEKMWDKIVYSSSEMDIPRSDWEKIKNLTVADLQDLSDYNKAWEESLKGKLPSVAADAKTEHPRGYELSKMGRDSNHENYIGVFDFLDLIDWLKGTNGLQGQNFLSQGNKNMSLDDFIKQESKRY